MTPDAESCRLDMKHAQPAVSHTSSNGVPQAAFAEALHVGRPNRGDWAAFQARMETLWNRNWLTNNGPFVQEFEERIAEHVGVANCVCMSNATVALEI